MGGDGKRGLGRAVRMRLAAWDYTALAAAVIGLGLALLLFLVSWSTESRTIAIALDADTTAASTRLQHTIEVGLDDLRSLAAFFRASHSIDREEFATFARHELHDEHRAPGLQALIWAPLVRADQRPIYEAAAVQSGLPAFTFTESSATIELVPARSRAEYVPIYYVAPMEGNEPSLGYDLASQPKLRAALAARDGDALHIVQLQAPGRPDDGTRLTLFILPVHAGAAQAATASPSGRRLAGYVAVALRADALLAAALSDSHMRDLELTLFDRTDQALLASHSTSAGGAAGLAPAWPLGDLHRAAPVAIAGHTWELVARPSVRYVAVRRTLMPWAALVGGIALTGLLELYLLQRRRAEARLRKSRQLLAISQQIMHVGSYEIDLATGRIYWSDEVFNLYGLASAPEAPSLEEILALTHPDDRDQLRAYMKAVAAEWPPRSTEYRIIRPDGEERTLHTEPRIDYDAAGRPVRVVGALLDITARKKAEERLRQAAIVFENTLEGVIITDPDMLIVAVNRAFSAITGYSEAEVIGRTPRILQSGCHDQAFYRQLWDELDRHGRWQGEVWNRRKNGEVYPEGLTVSAVSDEGGRVVNYIAVFTDISDLKRSEEQLAHLAHYDALTELPNRLLLFARLEHALERARRQASKVALLFLDLDRFKNINDSLGHPIGDELLVAIARRLQQRVRTSDTLARLGGDEFVILLEEIQSGDEAATVARQLIDLLGQSFVLPSGHEVYTGGSIGISIGPDDADSAAGLIRNADTAMYQAKAGGGETFRFYTEAMTRVVDARLDLEGKLRRALERQEFVLYYQPQIDLANGRVVGVEALIRWQQPEHGLIPPAQFIPVAEETGLIVPIGEWVLRAACAQLQTWRAGGLTRLHLAINLSSRQFRQPHLVQMIEEILATTGLPADCLELEITESAVMEQPEQAIATLKELTDLGIHLAIDDFGTGYSSLAYLQRFTLNKLKIDRGFITELPHRASDASIAATIIAMAHNLGLHVVAEGVETVEQLAWLRRHACDRAQGYLFSRPLPPEQLSAVLSSGGHRDIGAILLADSSRARV